LLVDTSLPLAAEPGPNGGNGPNGPNGPEETPKAAGCVFPKPWESLVKTEMKTDEKGFAFRSKEAGIGNLPEMDGIHTK